MPKSKNASALSILQLLSQQREGFKFGEPQRIDEKSLCVVLPILRETSLRRQYTTLPETDKVSIIDTGSINKMRASSVSTDNVFIRSGTIFKGATQERTSVRSTVIFPGKTVDIEVRCVHASRGISPNSKVSYGGISPLSVDNAVYGVGFSASDQHTFWNNVSKTSNLYSETSTSRGRPMASSASRPMAPAGRRSTGGLRHAVSPTNSLAPREGSHNWVSSYFYGTSTRGSSLGGPISPGMDSYDVNFVQEEPIGSAFGSDDLSANLDAFAKNFDDILSKIKQHEYQTGMALINEKGCQTIETFDVPASWQSLHKDAVKRVGSHVVNLDDTSVFSYKPEKAIEVTCAVLSQDYDVNLIYNHKPANGEPEVTISGLTSKDFVGEVVEIDNRVSHLLLLRRSA